jgi:PAS domain S-box-containing protein
MFWIHHNRKPPQIPLGRSSAAGILVVTVGGIALAEVVAMIFVYYTDTWPYAYRVLLDASIMVLIITPLLYFLSARPLLREIRQRQQSERILQTRLRLMDYANEHSLPELLQFTLDEFEMLTGSDISFIHFMEANQTIINMQAWSSNTLQNMCRAESNDSHYDIERAGVWADAARLRQTVIHNDYDSLPDRKGMPEGHARVVREMVVPVLRDKKVMAILGVGNKPADYTESDAELVMTLADFFWDIVNHKQADLALLQSEEKFRTFVDWTYDWEMWMDPDGKILYTSPSCERITGYRPAELAEDTDLLASILHPEDKDFYQEHQKIIHNPNAGVDIVSIRIIARDGSEHWLEHVCRPLYAPDGRYLGRRISNRDITERKQAEKKIAEQNRKEAILTQTIQTIQADIARDLHDMLGQNIGFLSMNLEHLSETQFSDPARDRGQIQHMTRVANESYELIRAMLAILTNGHSTDPLVLFTRHAEQVAERSGIPVEVTNRGKPVQLSPQQVRQLFYIFREALRNVEKYAGASRVGVDFLWTETGLVMEISDDGVGFDPQHTLVVGHYGLRFMRERAELTRGSFSLQTAPGQGTTIRVAIPVTYESSISSQ